MTSPAKAEKYSLLPGRLDQPMKKTLSNVLSESLFASVSKYGRCPPPPGLYSAYWVH